jgi:tRNA A37 threonylcarbamoyltransferase TsaD
MIVLGIETSCDETAAALVADDRRAGRRCCRSVSTGLMAEGAEIAADHRPSRFLIRRVMAEADRLRRSRRHHRHRRAS